MVRWINHKRLKRCCYCPSDRLLIGRPCGFGKLSYTCALWKPWPLLRTHLILAEGSSIPGRWLIEDTLKVLPGFQDLSLDDSRVLAASVGRLGVHTIQDLWSMRDRRWRNLYEQLGHIRGIALEFRILTTRFLDCVTARQLQLAGDRPIAQCWCWTSMEGPLELFSLPNKSIYTLLLPICNDLARLNRVWQCSLEPAEWQALWSTLWAADLSTRLKVFFWRIISQGFYTLKKAGQIGRDTPFCRLCPTAVEDLPHIFQECSFAKTTWRAFHTWLQLGNRRGDLCFLEVVQHLFKKDTERTAHLMLFAQVTYSIWLSRNKHVLEGTPRFIALETPLRAAEDALRALALSLPPGRKYVRIIMAEQLVARWRTAHFFSHRDPRRLPLI
ncbi:unnamed protein product [Calypogeia fissa]